MAVGYRCTKGSEGKMLPLVVVLYILEVSEGRVFLLGMLWCRGGKKWVFLLGMLWCRGW